MHLACGHAEALARLAGDPGEQRRRIVVIEPVERPSQAIVVEHIRRDPGT